MRSMGLLGAHGPWFCMVAFGRRLLTPPAATCQAVFFVCCAAHCILLSHQWRTLAQAGQTPVRARHRCSAGGGTAAWASSSARTRAPRHSRKSAMPPIAAISPATLDRVRGALWASFAAALGRWLGLSGSGSAGWLHNALLVQWEGLRRAGRATGGERTCGCSATAPQGLPPATLCFQGTCAAIRPVLAATEWWRCRRRRSRRACSRAFPCH